MKPFVEHIGLVVPLDRLNVDTDQLAPKQFCKLLTREGYGRILFYDWRYLEGDAPNPSFVLNWARYQAASILLARANFGCGSSREHAPWALLDYGFRVVIAPSFADIFYGNCFKNGLLAVTLPDAQIDELFRRTEQNLGYKLRVDLIGQTVRDLHGLQFSFAIDQFRKECLLKGLDDIGLTLQHADRITAYEELHKPSAVMYEAVDVIIPTPKNY